MNSKVAIEILNKILETKNRRVVDTLIELAQLYSDLFLSYEVHCNELVSYRFTDRNTGKIVINHGTFGWKHIDAVGADLNELGRLLPLVHNWVFGRQVKPVDIPIEKESESWICPFSTYKCVKSRCKAWSGVSNDCLFLVAANSVIRLPADILLKIREGL